MSKELREHIEKIVQLTDREFEFILSHFTVKKFKKHQFLIQEGGAVMYNFWVKKGLVKAYHSDVDAKEYILQFASEDWWITDYQGYFNETKATLNINCLEDTEVFCLSLENCKKLCAELHKFEHFMLVKSNGGYVALQRRILSLLNSTAKERYDQFINLYPLLLQRIPKTYIAAYLGVSRETLSRFSSL